VRTKYQAHLFETEVAWPTYEAVDSPFVTMQVVPDDYRLTVKRVIDVAGALSCLVAAAPVMLAAALAIKVTSPGPVLFVQERYGLNRHRFWMLKFRTMVADAERQQRDLEALNEADGAVFKIADDPRLTRVGAFLRKSSIDELPQLFNVLRGEMSLVGPRPLPLRDVERFTRASDMRRFSVRPGLTCLWQINGRSGVGFDEWMTLDLKYIDAWSLGLDLRILLRTVPAVVRGTGAH
jgi:exopolysaccharide biosynthesis polyprenyl glycosylphosphotransferase